MERVGALNIRRVFSITLIVAFSGFAATVASAQNGELEFVTPGVNTNLIGVSPDDNYPDYRHKQQQEPSCIVQPSNQSRIMCGFNDLRAADDPIIQGDSWIGYSMSSDKGLTWRSGLVPGYKDHPNSLAMGFAADASLVAIPGADPSQVPPRIGDSKQSPGFAVLNYIAANRDSSVGVLAIQRFVENEQEDQLPWLPENEIHIVADGTSGRFIDKPAFLYVPDDAGSQGVMTEEVLIEGRAEPVTVHTPTGTLIVAYAVFTGSSSVKVMVQESKDNGRTWSNATKLSESMNEVTGVSLTAIGQQVVAVWRRKADTNEGDAVMTAYSNNAGRRWSKGAVMFDFCPFDQPASGVTFRTFAFPWAANDGNRFWAFATDRSYTQDGLPVASCDVVEGAPPGIYEGIPRIVGMSSADGINWVGGADPGAPFVLDPNLAQADDRPVGMQVMPSAFGSKGRIDIAWYDTRREEMDGRMPPQNPLPLINDYFSWTADGDTVTSLAIVLRKADVWMTRLAGCTEINGGCEPNRPDTGPVRVSKYPVSYLLDGSNSQLGGYAFGYETEAHLPNHRLYASGTLAFKGDYIAVAAPALRKNAAGEWIPNHGACSASGEQPGCNNKEDVFVAWGDNRDVRVDYNWLSANDTEQVPYTPPAEPPCQGEACTQTGSVGFKLGEINPGATEPLVEITPELKAVTESDDSTDPDLTISETVSCSAADFSRSRDANIYGAVIADKPSLVAPTPTKPLGSIQRAFPLVLNNSNLDSPKNFCLKIEHQPIFPNGGLANGYTTGRASFLQLPSVLPVAVTPALAPITRLPVTVPAGSSASRAVYIVTSEPGAFVRITAYEDINGLQQDACWAENENPSIPQTPDPYAGTLQDTIIIADGNLYGSEYCSLPENSLKLACSYSPVEDDVKTLGETHNISLVVANLQAPPLQAPVIKSANFQTANLQTPPLAAANFQTQVFEAANFQTEPLEAANFQMANFQTVNLQTANFQTANFQTLNFQTANFQTANLQAVNLQALQLINANLQALNFQTANFQTANFQTANFQTANLQTANFQTKNFQNVNLQAPTLSGSEAGDTGEAAIASAVLSNTVYYQDITYIVETDANVATNYTADIAFNLDSLKAVPEDPDEAVVQLIVWTPNEYNDSTNGCASTTRFETQVISSVTLKSANLADVELPFTKDVNEEDQEPNTGEVSFTSAPGQKVALTVRIWATGTAQTKLGDLYEEWKNCAAVYPLVQCENEGVGGLISFGASAQSCQTGDTYAPDGTDCLNSGNEKILQDRVPPSVDPVNPPENFVPADFTITIQGNNTLELTWPITGNDANPDDVRVECKVDGEDALLGDFDFDPDTGWFEQILSYDFKAGTNHVVCNISDASENTTTINFEIFIIDEEKPTITAPAPIIKEATGPNGVAVADVLLGEPAVSDNVGVVKVENDAPTEGYYGLGPTSVKWTAWDEQNNFAEATQTVTVQDTKAPVFGSLPNPNGTLGYIEATSSSGATVSWDPVTATDVVDGSITAICKSDTGLTSGSIFPIDTTQVTCTATDNAPTPNQATAAFSVTVRDTKAPVFTFVPADMTVEATGPYTSVAIGTATATDDVGPVTITNNAQATFGLGSTTVIWRATDGEGNYAEATQTVTVEDTTEPDLTAPADITVEATAANGATVSWPAVIANDDVDGDITASCQSAAGLTSGSTFPIGTTPVTCTATDSAGITATAAFNVTVKDSAGPVINTPVEARVDYYKEFDQEGNLVVVRQASGIVDYSLFITAQDVIDGPIPVTECKVGAAGYSTSSEFTFSDAPHVITCKATDSSGNVTESDVHLTVLYLYDTLLVLPKGRARAGSTVPLDWYYLYPDGPNQGSPIDDAIAADIDVRVSWKSMLDSECLIPNPNPPETDGTTSKLDGDSGYSDFRYSDGEHIWQFSWQTPPTTGWHKVAVGPPGADVKGAWGCINLR